MSGASNRKGGMECPSPLDLERLSCPGRRAGGWSRLLGRGRRRRRRRHDMDRHLLARLVEAHRAVDQGEQGVVLADADILALVELGAALADDDVAGEDLLAAELLDAQAPTGGIAAVARAAACLFMCHMPAPALAGDAGDLEDRQVLAMTVLAPRILAPPLLENDDLVAAGL